jgi:hypothetical protein
MGVGCGGENQFMTPFLSCIYVMDELPFMEFLPWRESLDSVLRFADEVIVVHGGKTDATGKCPSLDYLRSLHDSRIRVSVFLWPEKFDWRQIALTCTFGHLQVRGEWCFRALADEVFPDNFEGIRKELESQPEYIKIVSVDRLYMLGNQYACPFHDKPLFFRNDRSVGYGTVNPAQGESASYLLFDDPLETDRWFDGNDIVSIRERSFIRDPKGIERLQRGEVPCGYRGVSTDNMTITLPVGVLNVDVNFYPDKVLLEQKNMSQYGYQRLPFEYPHRPILSRDELANALEKKIRGMIKAGKLIRVQIPEALHQFIDKHCETTNRVRRLCEDEYGLPWNRLSRNASVLRRIMTLASNRLRNLSWMYL